MRITLEAHGIKEAGFRINRLALRAQAPEPALEEIADRMHDIMSLNIQSQGRRGGGSWPALSEDWRYKKMALNLDPRMLVATETLWDAMADRSDPHNETEIGPNTIKVATSLVYARTQQKGDPSRNIPARPYVKFMRRDIQEFAMIIGAYLMGKRK